MRETEPRVILRAWTLPALALCLLLCACSDDTGATDLSPLPELGGSDQLSPDAPSCRQNGEACGGVKGSCCKPLQCCSGPPIPAGREHCASTCPVGHNLEEATRPVSLAPRASSHSG